MAYKRSNVDINADSKKFLSATPSEKFKNWNTGTYAYTSTAGTKYNGERKGLDSLLDKKINERKDRIRAENYGDGAVRYAAISRDGTIDTKAEMNIDGRKFPCNSKGMFVIHDDNLLKEIQEQESQRLEYVESILEKCIVSNTLCIRLLDIDSVNDLGAKNSKKAFGLDNDYMSDELDAYNCQPSYLNALPPNSVNYAGGICKLRLIIASQMPMVSSMTSKSVANENVN